MSHVTSLFSIEIITNKENFMSLERLFKTNKLPYFMWLIIFNFEIEKTTKIEITLSMHAPNFTKR